LFSDGMSVRPIFLFSLPRSGSTLVQRVIAAHRGVATTSEPWLLLPHIYASRSSGIVAEYPHRLLGEAIEDFCEQLPGGAQRYREELHDFIARLYDAAAGPEATHFLDKSPPYHLVAGEIMRLFPEARCIFLWRNPLGIISSLVRTWLDGQWRPLAFRQQLFVGVPRLVSSCLASDERAYSVRYEDLVTGEEQAWRELMGHLEIEFEPRALSAFRNVSLEGRHGDPTGHRLYSSLSVEPTDKWRETIDNPLRMAWCKRYLRFLGERRLEVMGFDLRELLGELESQPLAFRSLGPDLRILAGDIVKEPVRARMRRGGLGGASAIGELLRAGA
jgi:Sulfotransferase family